METADAVPVWVRRDKAPESNFRIHTNDAWHRSLTGRQSPDSVTAKLQSIYGSVLNEAVPKPIADLLAELDQMSSGEK